MRTCCTAALTFALAQVVSAQPDPLAGDWRGTLKPAEGTASPIVITITKKGDAYGGFTSGLNVSGEVALDRVVLTGDHLAVQATAESKLGQVILAGDLVLAGNTLRGPATLSVGSQRFDVQIELQRRPRATIPQ